MIYSYSKNVHSKRNQSEQSNPQSSYLKETEGDIGVKNKKQSMDKLRSFQNTALRVRKFTI